MSKLTLTTSLIDEAKLDISIGEAVIKWWHSPKGNSYRLSNAGYKQFKLLEPPRHFQSMLPVNILNTFRLIGKLNCPWYLTKKYSDQSADIYLFSTKIATTVWLYGNIDTYLRTLK